MLALLLIGLGGLVAPLVFPVNEVNQLPFRPAWMLSAPTGILEITRDRSWTGSPAAVVPQHWQAIAAILILGLLTWSSALVRAHSFRSRPRLN
jgi:hypothetical protein